MSEPTESVRIQARWLSLDPAAAAAADPTKGQTQGKSAGNSASKMPASAYVGGRPLQATGPLGLFMPRGGFGDPCGSGGGWVPILYSVGGGGGGGVVISTPSGTGSGALLTCTAGICSPDGSGSGPAVANSFLGFHLACEQAILLPSATGPISCRLFFLGVRLGSADITRLLGLTPIAVSFTGTPPVPAFPLVGAGVEVQYAVAPAERFQWLGLGAAAAFPPVLKASNGGPLLFGDVWNAGPILSGWVSSMDVQPGPFFGAQAIWGGAGALGGPTIGRPGISASGTWPRCSPL